MWSATTALDDRRYTMREYLEFVATHDGRFEYVDGKIIDILAMAGASDDHALITANLTTALGNALKGNPCRVYSSDLIIRIHGKSRYRLGDVSVVCPPVEREPETKDEPHAVKNPKLIVEVLSENTERDNRGVKFAEYAGIPSFEEYVLVSQTQPGIETYRKQQDGTWVLSWFEGIDVVIPLKSIGVNLLAADVYSGITFPPVTADDQADVS